MRNLWKAFRSQPVDERLYEPTMCHECRRSLELLAEHQPLPPSRAVSSNDLICRFNEVREFFAVHKDERCVPLLLNAFGEGDGHGVYQLVEDTVLEYPKDLVVQVVCDCLEPDMYSEQ